MIEERFFRLIAALVGGCIGAHLVLSIPGLATSNTLDRASLLLPIAAALSQPVSSP